MKMKEMRLVFESVTIGQYFELVSIRSRYKRFAHLEVTSLDSEHIEDLVDPLWPFDLNAAMQAVKRPLEAVELRFQHGTVPLAMLEEDLKDIIDGVFNEKHEGADWLNE